MEKVTETADAVDEAEKKMTVNVGWCEEHAEELRVASFNHAKDTVKKGDSLDFLSCFCGVFAITCFAILLYFGIKNGTSDVMLFLMPVYVLIAVFSLCHPLQVKISRAIWKVGFKKRIAVNKGYEPKLTVIMEQEAEEAEETVSVKVTGPDGEEKYDEDDCLFYETENYVIVHITDKKLFPVEKDKLEGETLEFLRGLCADEEDSEEEFDEEIETFSETE